MAAVRAHLARDVAIRVSWRPGAPCTPRRCWYAPSVHSTPLLARCVAWPMCASQREYFSAAGAPEATQRCPCLRVSTHLIEGVCTFTCGGLKEAPDKRRATGALPAASGAQEKKTSTNTGANVTEPVMVIVPHTILLVSCF